MKGRVHVCSYFTVKMKGEMTVGRFLADILFCEAWLLRYFRQSVGERRFQFCEIHRNDFTIDLRRAQFTFWSLFFCSRDFSQ